jgi:hypothetical protein
MQGPFEDKETGRVFYIIGCTVVFPDYTPDIKQCYNANGLNIDVIGEASPTSSSWCTIL